MLCPCVRKRVSPLHYFERGGTQAWESRLMRTALEKPMNNHPYAANLGDRDPSLVMAETPVRLRTLLDRLSPGQIEHPPAPGKWNFREVLAHLADCEIVWAWRLRIAYEKDNALLQPFDQDPWARIYHVYAAEQALAAFIAVRAWNLTLLSGLSEADKQRPVTQPEVPGMTLWTIARTAAGHDLHHLAAFDRQWPR